MLRDRSSLIEDAACSIQAKGAVCDRADGRREAWMIDRWVRYQQGQLRLQRTKEKS